MSILRSKITSQGQVSIPAELRKKLGVGPGSVVKWEGESGRIVVRRAGTFSSEDIHRSLFPEPARRTLEELKEGLRRNVATRHARD